jgi:hypothetical protein
MPYYMNKNKTENRFKFRARLRISNSVDAEDSNGSCILLFTRVGTYVQRGSKFCFVVVVLLLILVLTDTFPRILHFGPISPWFQHIAPLHATLPGSLARQKYYKFYNRP